MAQVFVGHDLLLARPVAVKLPLAYLARREVARRRFHQEALAAARLSHPNVVAVYDTGTDGDQEFLVMELVQGTSLREVLTRRGRLEAGETVSIGAQVASALDVAHRAGLVHRDVKPANILLTPDGQAKVTDFGIAKAVHDDDATQTGVTMGTARYLSPEQIEGRPFDGRADQYGLGVVLYEMLCGRAPFESSNDIAVALDHLRRPPLPVRLVRPEVPEWLESVVLRCLAKDPGERFETAGELQLALEAGDTRDGREAGDGTAPSRRVGAAPWGLADSSSAPLGDGSEPVTAQVAVLTGVSTLDAGAVGKLRAPRQSLPPGSGLSPRRGGTRDERPSGHRRRHLVPVAAGLVALVGLVVLGVVLARAHSPARPRPRAAVSQPAPRVVPVIGALSYNPEGTGPEDPAALGNLYDGNPATLWQTEWYANRQFGNLKSGTGFVLELGQVRTVGRLVVVTTTPGWTAQVYVADHVGPDVTSWGQPVAVVTDTGTSMTVSWARTRGSYVLVWFTELGPAQQAGIGEATLYT
jgi:hypothetical protein